ncbi:uncharacterized protein PpBr36_06263 [Pyricularia pennisetigena]|uniref:uncharacterized protein n=1 Tax=Pyricularia pennisetigena TaxID=1578925 RepID=UPI001150B0C0|nr:uncharacterized protein PpBr36_06263 [Pyricularia pennisetigena]TLS23484.1 hypothetical protein PpBr36_06263 [Pyricularia pennisetigena]
MKDSAIKKPKFARQNDQVMGTNNSSIASKRSVEKIYYPDEPHFFRYFVKKFQRRAPLINRGYYLRLHLIDCVVRDFLREPLAADKKTKVVVNLGCGSDVLPWQCLTRYSKDCDSVLFVDVDFPDLILRKQHVVLETPELRDRFEPLEKFDTPPVFLRSSRYVQVGCDLRNIGSLQAALESLVDITAASFLFVAEVSITYMETDAADAVIQWASKLGDSTFCLLEQILPDGPHHPFAQTMISHFKRLNTPLKSIDKYPTQQSQSERFQQRGWSSVHCWTLWQAWADDRFLTAEDRRKLDDVEAFDEWEEFALFGSHYVLLKASTRNLPSSSEAKSVDCSNSCPPLRSLDVTLHHNASQSTQGPRRFGTAMVISDVLGQSHIANVLGTGTNLRLRSLDLYSPLGSNEDAGLSKCSGPAGRLCHAFTDTGDNGYLLSGGRASPTAPMDGCWVFDKGVKDWRRTHDLPVGLYRHTAVRLGHSSLALTFGGKTGASKVFDGYLLYHPQKGWVRCKVKGDIIPCPVFGAVAFCSKGTTRRSPLFRGVLAGGITEEGVITDQILRWEVEVGGFAAPSISFTRLDLDSRERNLISRFGASCIKLTEEYHVIIGGVRGTNLLPHDHDVLILRDDGTSPNFSICSRVNFPVYHKDLIPRHLAVGSSIACNDQGQIILVGGGATCFSMGTFWTKGAYTFLINIARLSNLDTVPYSSEAASPTQVNTAAAPTENEEDTIWASSGVVLISDSDMSVLNSTEGTRKDAAQTSSEIPRVRLTAKEDFEEILRQRKPVIIEGASLGPCMTAWSDEYLVEAVGADREVSVHESPSQVMDFNSKNFRYVNKKFGEFVQEIASGQKLYLRALSSDEPTARAANLQDDFPRLAKDFTLPSELTIVRDNIFSSVLRMSGPVNMWLHYDVMANVYCQIRGSKRFVLFPPCDITELSIAPGGSSSSIDVFASIPARTHPHETTLAAGDVLFLPPLWLHTATPASDSPGVAVNVFFRDMDAGYSPGRDVYGNRDLAAYEKARRDVDKIMASFKSLPGDAREFYLKRLAEELRQGSMAGA